jgi:hypothetical protein
MKWHRLPRHTGQFGMKDSQNVGIGKAQDSSCWQLQSYRNLEGSKLSSGAFGKLHLERERERERGKFPRGPHARFTTEFLWIEPFRRKFVGF